MSGRLFSPLNPLKLSMSDEFFRSLPSSPGVYRMFDHEGELLYVGKAKNLQARLKSYRSACPLDLPRKVARLVHRIRKISFETLLSEKEALLRENQLLRELKPPFNRVNTHPEYYRVLGLRFAPEVLEFQIQLDQPSSRREGWEYFGCFRSKRLLEQGILSLAQLLWYRFHPAAAELPFSLLKDRPSPNLTLGIGNWEKKEKSHFLRLLRGISWRWVEIHIAPLLEDSKLCGFQKYILNQAKENLLEFYERGPQRNRKIAKAAQLNSSFISAMEFDDACVKWQCD